jgi:Ca-activated chloride channel family protein
MSIGGVMKRYHSILLSAAGFLLILSSIAGACIIVPPPHPPPHPPPYPPPYPRPWPVEFPLETKEHRAEISIRNNVATTAVHARFYNRSGVRMEGEYLFPVQPDAVVTDFSMTANGKTLAGELLPAEEARRIYEETVRKMRDPGLLEFMGTGVIRARVYPIEPRSEVTIELTYSQVLVADSGTYHFRYPIRSAKPPGEANEIGHVTLTVDLQTEGPTQTAYSPTYDLMIEKSDPTHLVASFEASSFTPETEFDFYYSQKEQPIGFHLLSYRPTNEEDGFFYLTVSPPDEGNDFSPISKDLLFVLDTSGSMAGKKIQHAAEAMTFCLESLDPSDRFNVLTFSTRAERVWDQFIPASMSLVEETIRRLSELKATGGTALFDAVSQALSQEFQPDRLGMVVFLTDGLPTVGNTSVSDILAMVDKENTHGTRFFVFGVGDDLNTQLLDGLARLTRGTREYVAESEEIEVKISSLYRKISKPVLADLALELGSSDAHDVYPLPLPDLFAGEELVVLGRYRQEGKATIQLQGRQGGESREFHHEARFRHTPECSFIPRIWAGGKVTYLLEQIRLNGPSDELVNEIKDLGERYGIVTPYTSLLILEDEDIPGISSSFESTRWQFEREKAGAAAVDASKMMASMRAGSGVHAAPAPRIVLPESFKKGAPSGYREFQSRLNETVKHVHDKTFYVSDTGEWVDSEYAARLHDANLEEIELYSDRYFVLLASIPEAAKYLSAHGDMLLVLEGRAYRVASP